MQVIHLPAKISEIAKAYQLKHKKVGLVPTMGALHDGHMALIAESVAQNDVTIVSIFVNPIQFNNSNDLKNYPRDLDKDLTMLKGTGVDLVFTPEEDAMYPEAPVVTIDFGPLSQRLEGEFRPGHFNGVGVVVAKLLHICQPTRIYFGLKDLQQYLLIRKMMKELLFPAEVVGVPIVREPSGLAMSSRNQRLSEDGREIANKIYEGLMVARKEWEKEFDSIETKSTAIDFYSKVEGLEVEYFEIVNPESLEKIEKQQPQPVALCFAGYVEGVRLIDNLYLR